MALSELETSVETGDVDPWFDSTSDVGVGAADTFACARSFKGQRGLLVREFGVPVRHVHAHQMLSDEAHDPPPSYDQLTALCNADDYEQPAPPFVPPFMPILLAGNLQGHAGPNHLYILPDALSPARVELERRLNAHYDANDAPPLCHAISSDLEGLPCVAKFSEAEGQPGAWYRARVKSVDGDEARVYFVDWGNTARMPLADLKPLHVDFAELPPLVVHCHMQLRLIEYEESPWPRHERMECWQKLMQQFAGLVKVSLLSLQVDELAGDPFAVELFARDNAPTTKVLKYHFWPMDYMRCLPAPEDETAEMVAEAHARIADIVKSSADSYEARLANARIPPTDAYDERDEDFPSPPNTVEGRLQVVMSEHEFWQATRSRQKEGPSRKVSGMMARDAALRAQGMGPKKVYDYRQHPDLERWIKQEVYEGYRDYIVRLLPVNEKWHLNGQFLWDDCEVVVSHVVSAACVYVYTSQGLCTLKAMEEQMQREYTDESAALPDDDLRNIDGILGVRRDPRFFDRFVRVQVLQITDAADPLIRTVAIDHGWRLPDLPWSERHRLKRLHYAMYCRDRWLANRIKLRYMVERLEQRRADTAVLRRLLPPWSAWRCVLDDRRSAAPFRAQLYVAPGCGRADTPLLELFDEAVERQTGRRPEHKLRPLLPRKGHELTKAKMSRRVERMNARIDMQHAYEPVAAAAAPSTLPGRRLRVIVSSVEHAGEFYLQTPQMAEDYAELDRRLNDHYKEMTSGTGPMTLGHVEPTKLKVGMDVVVRDGDRRFHRARIVDQEISRENAVNKVLRVRLLDTGKVWPPKDAWSFAYPLIKVYRDQTALCFRGCLDLGELTRVADSPSCARERRVLTDALVAADGQPQKVWDASMEQHFGAPDELLVYKVRLFGAAGESLNEPLHCVLIADDRPPALRGRLGRQQVTARR